MSKPMCPATDTEASLRIQVIRKKKQAAQDRFCINWTHESSENVLLKTASKESVCKILRGRGGANKVYYGWCADGEFLHLPVFLEMAAKEITFHTHQYIK